MRRALERWEARRGLDHLTRGSRRLVLGSFAVLALLLALAGWRLQGGNSPLAMLIYLLPLLLFLPSLISGRPRGHAWLAFVSLLYFMMGVNIAILPGLGVLGLAIVVAALTLFVGATGYARFRSRQLRGQD
ncbi:DUF2069 domain-containing protein [Bisbaumannia pacifica]|uniref:DUF2069 domain-containing protein n=1 Tax=Bisbaumannia pacifica TaxID=77098 RepID=A0A510X5A0_9GAMM|nr:DUF2069 domain-containing protein [Halomonas pacifica]MBH8578837.1 DUF2069 domain-containing protein [Halomonas pacifica]GEK46596.1 hypothetical protein HPA02_08790 [Halomonas pacifica]